MVRVSVEVPRFCGRQRLAEPGMVASDNDQARLSLALFLFQLPARFHQRHSPFLHDQIGRRWRSTSSALMTPISTPSLSTTKRRCTRKASISPTI